MSVPSPFVDFPSTPTAGDVHYDITSGASWVWTGAKWQQLSPSDIYPHDSNNTYSPGDLVYYPADAAQAGFSRVYFNSSTGFLGPNLAFDPADWTAVLGSFMRGWFDPAVAGGGPGTPAQIINGSINYGLGDYAIVVQDGNYDFATGQPTPAGTPTRLREGDRIYCDGNDWLVFANSGSLMLGWFDPAVAGGGPAVPQPVVDGTDGYVEDEYVVSENSGRYNFATGQPDPAGVAIVPGSRIRYTNGTWDVGIGPQEAFRGYFDPNTAGGGSNAPFPVIESSPDYSANQYLIAETAGAYDFNTGQPDPFGEVVPLGSVVRYNGPLWEVLSVGESLNQGYFDPTQPNGGGLARGNVVDGTLDYRQEQYVIAQNSGWYDFATGQPDPLNGGAGPRSLEVRVSDRAVVGADPLREWFIIPVSTELMKGWFDPTVQDGGAQVDSAVVNNSSDYVTREFVTAIADGWYDFGTGNSGASPTAVWVRSGESYRYEGSVFLLAEEDGNQFRGFADFDQPDGALIPAVVNSATDYRASDYVISLNSSRYDFVTGQPVASPSGVFIPRGISVRWTGTVWEAVPFEADSQEQGTFDPNTGDINGQAGNKMPLATSVSAGAYFEVITDSTIDQTAAATAGVLAELVPEYPVDVTDPLLGGGVGLFHSAWIWSDGTVWNLLRNAPHVLDDLRDVSVANPTDGYLLKYDEATLQWVPRSPDVSRVSELIDQVAHGFTTGTSVYLDGSGVWQLAMADNIDTLRKGVAISRGSDTFEVVYQGVIDNWAHGLNSFETRYLSDTTPGANNSIAPTAINSFRQVAFLTETADRVRVVDQIVMQNNVSREFMP